DNGFSSDATKFSQDAARVALSLEDGLESRSFFKVEVGGIRKVIVSKLLENPCFAGSADSPDNKRFSVRFVFPYFKYV
ncbi:MAG TPA: hypothetical protein O0X34_07200, partial [Methanocorpusculum sp.]|nr:hypothetical protein [Methanocorpusculum sp.]